ncbi:adhesin-like protein [Methanobrevibacter ruminantium M1]|uniref:Adhesin-like protein n=1 Tax=Methanobrevibacter ruminantium (strain ATCC 35063 / DSM 1093 / JCM 13430 / OCM 146 / M1) TaxID=634498 RepID=D3E0R9_METRM|nr:Ig-like domain repeat protein [Methanobrevibacter ruminantium]ADC47893.1 adhesin-like protein [Methanobrevibacter ruminantium M1]
MNKRIFLYIALIFIISLLSFSAVSANEDISSDNLILDENVYDEKIILDDVQDKNIISDNDYDDVIPVENANDNAILAGNDEELILDENNSEISEDNKNDKTKLSDPNTYSFTRLNQAINSGASVINLTDNYQYTEGDESFIHGIMISRSITINGNGMTISGSGVARIFEVFTSNVIINNITFRDAYAEGDSNRQNYGGAIFMYGSDSIVQHCKFINNNANNAGGGAIVLVGSNSRVEYSDFTGNNGQNGGAVYLYGNNTKAIYCNFTSNNASEKGGAVYTYGSDITVEFCNFTNNSAYLEGGAIDWEGERGTVKHSSFANNTANNNGGAISWYTANGTVEHSNFINNRMATFGGAIWWYGEKGTVKHSNFTNNSGRNGGAIQWSKNDGTVENSNFTNNTAILAGAVRWVADNGTIKYSRFINNHGYSAGAIDYHLTYANISGCLFINNTSDYRANVYEDLFESKSYSNFNNNILLNNGGNEINFNTSEGFNADYNWFGDNSLNYLDKPNIYSNTWLFLQPIVNHDSVFLGESCEITFRLYSYDGTEVHEYDNALVYPIKLTLNSNYGNVNDTVGLEEKAIFTPQTLGYTSVDVYAEGSYIGSVPINVYVPSFSDLNRTINGNEDSIITLNKHYIFDPETDAAFINGVIINRTVTINGNGFTINGSNNARIFQVTASNVAINNVTFANGYANGSTDEDKDGGAIHWSGANGNIENSTFYNNHATGAGGAIIWQAQYGNVSTCLFINNTADDGANVYHNNYPSDSHSNFNNNIMLYNGNNEVHFTVYNGSNADYNWFGHNSSNYNDATTGIIGDIWLFLNATANPDTILISNSSEISYKLYAYNGREIQEYDNHLLYPITLTLSSTNGIVNDNVALEEKVIFTPQNLGTATVTAKAAGTDIQTISIKVFEASFSDLNRTINGNEGFEIILDKNYAYIPEIDAAFINGINITHTVTINGNGNTINGLDKARIFQVTAPNVTIDNITFINGYANDDGGAINWQGPNGIIINSEFINNHATSAGGAIRWFAQYGNVSACLFINNTADDGASVYYNDYPSDSHSNFNNNIMLYNGNNEVHFTVYEGSNADYNWFGNNLSNYNERPTGFDGNVWLFLNATANPLTISISESSEIRYKLYAYDGRNILDYNRTLLYPINLTLTSLNGNIEDITEDKAIFAPENLGIATVTTKAEGIDIQKISINVLYGTIFYGSFSDLNRTINGNEDAEITLDKNYAYNPEIDTAFINGIVINRTLTINGNGFTINGSNKAPIFHITGDNVTINNISFVNGYANAYVNGYDGEDMRGGAIYWQGRNGKVTYSNFTNNNANDGGAIYWFGTDGIVEYSNFINNNANDGGAIYWFGTDGIVEYSNFINNNANDGGAIYWFGQNGNVENSVFTQNHAGSYGGAIYCSGAESIVEYSNFTNNNAYNGGAIYWFGQNGNVENSVFTQNHAGSYGGAIYCSGAESIVEYSNFTNNNAFNGGAIYWFGQNGNVENSVFTQNHATFAGGAIYCSGAESIVKYSNFTNNDAIKGGAIYWNGRNGNVENSVFTQNHVDNDGGALYWDDSEGKVTSCIFVNNTAETKHSGHLILPMGRGGAIYWNGRNGNVENSVFTQNHVDNDGGALYWVDSEGEVTSCIFVNNAADVEASVYYNERGAYSNFSNNIMLNNGKNEIKFKIFDRSNIDYNWFGNNLSNYNEKPGGFEGNIWLFLNATVDPNMLLLGESSEITFRLYAYDGTNVIEYDNDLIYPINLTLISSNGNINETVGLEETAIFTPQNVGTAIVTAKAEGFDIQTVSINVRAASFSDLNRTINGNEDAEITLGKYYEFDPETDGAFIHGIIINRTVTINGNGTTINASGKARIFQVIADNVTLNNITFTNGNASGEGADRSGGAIRWEGANGIISYSNFTFNHAYLTGGAIIWSGENGTVKHSSFSQNDVDGSGGAIRWAGAKGTITDSDFYLNSATDAGAIWWLGAYGTVKYSNLINNHAGSRGGAIMWSGENGNVTYSNFSLNNGGSGTGYDGGGAIFWDHLNGTVSYSNFSNNHINGHGGAIAWHEQYGNVSSCLFVNNTATDGASVYHNDHSESYSNFNNNILLNNGENEIHYDVYDGSNADYNWFGNNGSNYNEKPAGSVGNVWLFLNATADPNPISILGSSDVSFKLYAYDGLDLIEYDNNLLYPIILSLSSSNGNINDTAGLDEKIIFTPQNIGTATVTAKAEGIFQTLSINVYPPSFSDLNRTINGNDDDEITLDKYYEFNPELDSAFIHGIIINRTVTINGNGSTINGSSKARIFQVIAPDVVLNNITFANGNANGENEGGYGGAILWEGDNGRVEDSTFINNNASGYGGAIFGGNCSDNVIFQNNHAGIEGDDWYVPKPVISVNDFTSTYKSGEKLYVNVSYVGTQIDGINVTISVFDSSNQLIGNYSCLSGDGWTVDLDAGNYNALVFVDSDEYGYGEETIALTINKRASQISANPLNTTYNGNENIIMILKDNYNESIANATVLVDFNGEKNLTTDENGQIVVSANGIVPGEYWAQFIFDGSKNYDGSDEKVKVIISKASTSLSSENMNVSYNESKYLIATLKDQYSNPLAEISIEFKSNSSTVKNENTDNKGQAKLLIDFNPGTYNIDISFAGNSLYDASYATVTVVVNPSDDSGNGTEPSGNGSSGNGTSPEGNGTSPGGNGTSPSGNGTSPGGNGTSPSGNGTSPGGNGTDPGGNGTSPSGNGTDPGGNGTSPSGNGTSPGGNGTDPSGNGTSPGGNGTDPGGNGTSSTVKDTLIGISTSTVIYGNDELINLTLTTADKTPIDGVIELRVGNSIYNVTITGGKGSKALSNLTIGNYTVTADYKGDSEYNSSTASSSFTVRDRIETRIIYNNMTTAPVGANDGRIGNYFRVKLVDENNQALAGVPIQIGFNGRIYNRTTDSEGGAKLQINLAKEDGYTFAICFKGDDNYNASFEVAKIDVNKKYPKPNSANSESAEPANKTQKNTRLETSILYKDMKTESVLKAEGRAGKYFEIQLVDNNKKALAGVPIKIGFNGVVYDRITNATGGAKLQINLLKVTQYTFAIAYLGDSKYQASFEVAKITVNKQTPKITAPQKTFKAKAKTKTVTATLKSQRGTLLSGKKIKFTVNGKTYTGTTNSKGVASVKVSLSKKGTYTATAKFDGDANTKATSVKFKVKIS